MVDLVTLANSYICDLNPYVSGKSLETTAKEFDLVPEEIIKLASNENPLGPSAQAIKAIDEIKNSLHLYPDSSSHQLANCLAERLGVESENMVFGNGSNEIIELLCHCFLNTEGEVISSRYSFLVYRVMTQLFGAKFVEVPELEFRQDLQAILSAITDKTRLIFFANPNNPTGTYISQSEIDGFMDQVPNHVVVVFDEAYYEFVDQPVDVLKYVKMGRSVCILRTYSKIYGLAGLRVGYGIAPADLTGLLHKARQPFNLNAVAQKAAIAAMRDIGHINKTRELNQKGLSFYEEKFQQYDLEYVPSCGNFILVKVGDAKVTFKKLLQKGVIIRDMTAYQLPEWVRISVGTMEQNHKCFKGLSQVLNLV